MSNRRDALINLFRQALTASVMVLVIAVTDAVADENSFIGEWHATSPAMEVNGFASLIIQKTADSVKMTLLDPSREPVPTFTIPITVRDGRLHGVFPGIAPYFDLQMFMAGPVEMVATRARNEARLDVAFTDTRNQRIDLQFYPKSHPRLRQFDVPQATKDGLAIDRYVYSPPKASPNGLPVSTLEAEGIDRSLIEDAVTDYLSGEYTDPVGFLLIVRNGKLVLEEYFHGANRDRLWLMHSVSKSVTSLLTGIAAHAGDIDLDAPINGYFPEYASSAWMRSSKEEGVTPRQLLRMANVIGWGDQANINPSAGVPAYASETSRFYRTLWSQGGWLKQIFSYPIVTYDPDPYYNYNTLLTYLLGATLERATGSHLSKYVQDALLGPLGEKRSYFDSYGSVLYGAKTNEEWPALAGSTLMIRPMALAKIGQLVLNKGEWSGAQIVPGSWIRESTAVKGLTFNYSTSAYAYKWELSKLQTSNRAEPVWVVSHGGYGGQLLVVVPVLDFVVVTGATDFMSDRPGPREFVFERIMPAVNGGETFYPLEIGAEDLETVVIK